MGVINVTPDSFADGGLRLDPDRAAADALAMDADGADLVDVGGESTRPGADPLSVDEELGRVLPLLDRLAGRLRAPISVDTYKAAVARAALARGAAIVNDVSGLRYDAALAGVVAETGAACVLVHSRGRPRDMYREAQYTAVADELVGELGDRLADAERAGIPRERIILDPGLGFGKRADHSYEVLARLDRLAALDRPLLVGPSRKSFLRAAVGDVPAGAREWGTAAAVAAAVLGGAHIVRVHGVREMIQVVRVADLIRRGAGM